MRSMLVSVMFGAMLSGCANRAFSPPAGWVPAEDPAVLGPDEQAVTVNGGVGLVGLGARLAGGEVRYRRGYDAMTELQVDVAGVAIGNGDREQFPWVLSTRVGAKGLVMKDVPHLSWSAGLGLGGSAAGGFSSGELGLQLGWVNPVLTPWVCVSGILSVPLGATEVNMAAHGKDPDFDHPVTTAALRFGFGLTGHLGPLDLTLAAAHLRLQDVDGDAEQVLGGTVSASWRW